MEDATKIEPATDVSAAVEPRAVRKSHKSRPTTKRRVQKRARREVRPYPSRSLEDAIKVTEAIKTQNSGNPWPPDEIAKAIKIKSRSSNLAEALRSANLYGLIDGSYRSNVVSLTELGRRLAYPTNDDELRNAKREALLSVDLFKKVLGHYRDGNLPEFPFINNTLEREFGLSSDFHGEFLKILRKNMAFVDTTLDVPPSHSPDRKLGVQVTPSNPSSAKTRLRAFVIMPFAEDAAKGRNDGYFREVYNSVIRPASERANFDPFTADRKGSDVIHTTILREILDADLVIADLTDHNPNVMFELGLRMALGSKPVCIMKSKDTGRVFDVDNVLRVYEYNQNLWPSTVEHDVPELTEHIRATWDARNTGSSYVEILTGRSGNQSGL